MDFIQLLIFSAVFILLSLMFQVFAVKVLNLPKPVKKQKPINGTHRLIEITLLITGIAAVTFFNETILLQRHNGMAAPAGGKAICVRFVLRGSFCRAWRAYFFHQSA
ncbi:heme/copper-type cytochrome/quinol oxidase subunit 2 [Bacillus velezensis]|nr:hypothetical protein [Bacillus velezensis]MCP1531981.1 heme/copper-type cytochrome/quinol oxidase subunit 2 [Bacillus velezensis]MEC3666390.1 hypothetical protein [Bacillus velezensis]